MRTITLEEHYASPAFLAGPGRELKEQGGIVGDPKILAALADVGDGRIAAMDAAGIDVQVLTLTAPSVQQLDATEAIDVASRSNDFLAAASKRHPERLAGFAALPTADPDAAAAELERMVKDHGFVGGHVDGHTQGRYLDDKFFWPLLERAEALDVPIYIHPTVPPQPVIDAYYAGFAPLISDALARHAWGWHIETAVHVLRMIARGVFDRFHGLQIIIGHMGEALPFMLPRTDHALPTSVTKLKRPVSAYLLENLHYTFSGLNYTRTFLDLYLEMGADRIMFSADYPYSSMAEAHAFLDRLPVSPVDKEKIAYINAERLLRL